MLMIRKGTTVKVQMQMLMDDESGSLALHGVTSVVMKLLDPGTREEVYSIDCEVVDESNGIIEFDPSTIQVGVYERKFEITFADGSVLVIPNARQEYIMVW